MTTSGSRLLIAFALMTLACMVVACEPYRIEYHTRPQFYQRMVDEPLPDRQVLPDGTIVVYNADPADRDAILGGEVGPAKTFSVRREHDDGTVTLHAIMPEHVVATMLHALQRQEYTLIWEQLLSEEARLNYEAEGRGEEEFAAFLTEHRVELARMLNRMRVGFATNEVVVQNRGGGVTECSFWPHVARLFRFKRVFMKREDFELKLFAIR